MSDSSEYSATVARRLIGLKQLSPIELLDACIRRIEATDASLGVFLTLDLDRARERARAAEAELMNSEPLGALHGIPVAMQDLEDTADLRTTYGSPIFARHTPDRDSVVVQRLRSAGAVIVGKTNSSEFGFGLDTHRRLSPPARNPFYPELGCGGGAGGSAAAVAASLLPLAIGSDTDASLRHAGSFCGVSTFRPTIGTIPARRERFDALAQTTTGPLARSITDCSLLLSAVAGFHPSDAFSVPTDPHEFSALSAIDLANLRVGFSEDLGFAPIDNTIRETFRERAGLFADVFGLAQWRDPPMANAERVCWLLRAQALLAAHTERYLQHADSYSSSLAEQIERALSMQPEALAWANAEHARIYSECQGFFDQLDILICPAAATLPNPIELSNCTEINGATLDSETQWTGVTQGASLLGHPVAQVPCGYGPTQMPFGIQVIGARRFSDRFVIGVATALERFFGSVTELSRPLPPS